MTSSNLTNSLLAHRPRETSGAMASNRFEYQRTWTLCHLLRLHESGQQYLVLLEYHDDVLTLDHELNPKSADFFQVKTRKSGHWKTRELVTRSKSPKTPSAQSKKSKGSKPSKTEPSPESIVGKLMEHCRAFLPEVRSLNIVSNATFDLPLQHPPASLDREKFGFNELTPQVLKDIDKAIKKELAYHLDLPWERVFMVTSGINITDHDTYGAGELAAFLDRRCPNGRFAVQPLYRTLCAELARRANNEWQPASFSELCRMKGVRRVDLEDFLQYAERQKDPEELLTEVKNQLLNEGLEYRKAMDIVTAWRRYDVQQIDQTDLAIQVLRSQLVGVVEKTQSSSNWQTLREFITEALANFHEQYGKEHALFDVKYLQGALLYECKAYECRQHSPPHPKPAFGTP